MIRTGRLLDRTAMRAARGLLAWSARRERGDWPESWSIVVGATLLGALAWYVFTVRVPDIEKTPAEMIFGFLGLYFYSVGFLSGRRTSKIGTGSWAGAACGLTFSLVVCLAMYRTAVTQGVHE